MSHVLKENLLRQYAIERKNFLAVCRLSIQTLCDESAATGVIDDNSEQLINFCSILEACLCHQYDKPSKKKNAPEADTILYWDFLKLACKSVPYNCIQKINQIDDVKTSRGKGRAWLRMALMEKRLSEYLSVALMEEAILKKFYLKGSFMLNEEAHILANVLTALNSVDFSLCLKSDVFDLPIRYSIDYSSFLKYPISDRQLDLEEALIRMERNRLHNDASSTCSGPTSTISEREPNLEEDLTKLKRQMKLVVDQKAYLEEILHLKEAKCTELTAQLLKWDEQQEKDKSLSDGIIVELQEQLAEQQLRTKQLEEELSVCRRGGAEGYHEMDPMDSRSRNSTNVSLKNPDFECLKGVDVIAHMDQNGGTSISTTSDQSVRRCSSDQSVQRRSEDTLLNRKNSLMRRSDETMQGRTSSASGSSRKHRSHSRTQFSKQ